jgi:hypothetical protein
MAALSQLLRSNSMGKFYGRLHYLGKSLFLKGIWSVRMAGRVVGRDVGHVRPALAPPERQARVTS